jgi:hypothetical protein
VNARQSARITKIRKIAPHRLDRDAKRFGQGIDLYRAIAAGKGQDF